MTTEAVDRFAEIYENEVGPAARRAGGGQGLDRPRVQAAAARGRHRGLRRARHRRPAGRGHGRRGEHRHGPQRHRLHAVLVLPVAGSRPAAELVQVARLPLPDGPRAPARCSREDFGYDVPDSVEIRVWDSSSEMRYWVLPQRPEPAPTGMSEKELAALVTRDSMIGVGPDPPALSSGMRPDADRTRRRPPPGRAAAHRAARPGRRRRAAALQRAVGATGLRPRRGRLPHRASTTGASSSSPSSAPSAGGRAIPSGTRGATTNGGSRRSRPCCPAPAS